MEASKSKMKTEFKVEIIKQEHVMPEMHYHDFFEIYIQDTGTRDHIVSSTFYELKPHEILLFKPNLLHQSISAVSHIRTVVYFTDAFLQQHFSLEIYKRFVSLFNYQHLSLTAENYSKVASIVRELVKEDYYSSENTIFARLAELLMVLLSNIKQKPPTKVQTNEILSASVSPLIAYVHENYLALDNIKEISDSFYITPSHLCRTFKKLTGYTITQYINHLKIHQACNLLQETDKSITEIALDCGFNSTMYFCKTFKSILNLTPREYRKI